MTQEQWTVVDRYITDMLVPSDAALEAALEANSAAGLPAHDVSPTQGKLLQLLAQIQGARRILEIGTLGGYSTIWLARALPADGRLITIECEQSRAAIALSNIRRAGLGEIVSVRVGKAIDVLSQLEAERCAPFDFIFIDADKPSNPDYLAAALKLSRPGTLLIADNVVRNGAVIDADSSDPNVLGIRRFHELLAADPRLTATAIQTVGVKGYDGFRARDSQNACKWVVLIGSSKAICKRVGAS